ncbi:hypothetical protein [uncultured Algibacter sp.]|jgi:hypothetical protein|uniref:hypothetical protein n=1 Tax=uncultured Algibacter sp. TaxID=298659 RepID=UPI002604B8AF|nr:hypothetical protein [uncultured Algibacter sp.]
MKLYLSFIIALIFHSSFSQSAWTKDKDALYTQLAFTTINDYNLIFGNPDYTTERNVTDNTLQFYGEYGLHDKTTLILNVPIKFIQTNDLVDSATGLTTANSVSSLGNIEIGVRQRFYKNKWIISGQFNIELNTSSFDNPSGIRTGFDSWAFTPTINFGRSFKKFYTQFFTGFNFRSNGYSTNFKLGGEIGTRPFKKILVIGFIDILKSFKDGDIVLPETNLLNVLYTNNQEYGAYGIKFISELTKSFGINAGFGGAFFGQNVAKEPALTLGIYHNF